MYGARAAAKSHLGQHDEAIADYSLALELDPGNTAAFVARGNLHYQRQDYPKAIADFTKAIELNPSLIDAYICRGGVFEANGQQSLAEADFEMANELQRLQRQNQ